MPQEIEVWYLVPALRRELAKTLIKQYRFSQKDVANVLDLTPAAVSQYLSSKRGKDINFLKCEKEKINNVAKKISTNPENGTKYLYNLCVLLRKSNIICRLHRKHDKTVSKKCDICGCYSN